MIELMVTTRNRRGEGTEGVANWGVVVVVVILRESIEIEASVRGTSFNPCEITSRFEITCIRSNWWEIIHFLPSSVQLVQIWAQLWVLVWWNSKPWLVFEIHIRIFTWAGLLRRIAVKCWHFLNQLHVLLPLKVLSLFERGELGAAKEEDDTADQNYNNEQKYKGSQHLINYFQYTSGIKSSGWLSGVASSSSL